MKKVKIKRNIVEATRMLKVAEKLLEEATKILEDEGLDIVDSYDYGRYSRATSISGNLILRSGIEKLGEAKAEDGFKIITINGIKFVQAK